MTMDKEMGSVMSKTDREAVEDNEGDKVGVDVVLVEEELVFESL
jgi:hypothetical protein